MNIKLINVCGFGNTGCTSQVDILCDYEGVVGMLSPLSQDMNGRTAYHELGVLKCLHSFGGIIVAKMNGAKELPTKKHLICSLLGIDPQSEFGLNFGAKLHLEMRERLTEQYGAAYRDVVHDSCANLPDDFNNLSLIDIIDKFRFAFEIWCSEIIKIVNDNPHLASRNNQTVKFLGLKNDPPGAYPLLATLIPDGITSAILRNPQDTTYDFNRHYGLGHTDDSVKKHCAHYNAQLNSAKRQIENYHDVIKEHYFVHEFEKLVLDSDYRDRYVYKMIGEQEKVLSNFDASKSKENIGHHVNMTNEQIRYVTENCEENYFNFKTFLGEKGLLLA